MSKWDPAADRGLWALSDPRLSKPSQDEAKEVLLWSEELGVNIAVCPCLQLISHTQETSTFKEESVRDYIFIKKCIRSFIEVRILSVDCFRIYLYMYTYSSMWLYNKNGCKRERERERERDRQTDRQTDW